MTQSKQQIKEDKAIVAIIQALGFDPEEVVQVIDSNVSGKTPVKRKEVWFDIKDHMQDFNLFLKYVGTEYSK